MIYIPNNPTDVLGTDWLSIYRDGNFRRTTVGKLAEYIGTGGGGGPAVWGDLTGTLADQTDLQAELNLKIDTTDLAVVALSGVYADLTSKPILGTAAATAATDYATAAQGSLADTALQVAPVSSVNGAVGAVVLGGETITEPVTVLTPASGVVTVDCSLGDYFTLAPTANITSIVFTNLPASNKAQTIMVRLTQDTTPRTVSWPASFKWTDGIRRCHPLKQQPPPILLDKRKLHDSH